MSATSGDQPPELPVPPGVDPASVRALAHLRHLVGGTMPLEGFDDPAAVAVPSWVPLGDRARARWLLVPVGFRAAAAVVGVLGALAVAWWLLRPPPVPAELTLPTIATTPPAAAPPATTLPESSTAVVHAAGSVRSPGIVELPAGARVADVIAAAGGAAPDADLDRLNLAAPAGDGTQIYVPAVGEEVPVLVAPVGAAPPADGISAGEGPPALVDLNAADQTALEALPGIGPATAAAILRHRSEVGRFAAVEDLLEVPGIGPVRFEALAPLVVVSG